VRAEGPSPTCASSRAGSTRRCSRVRVSRRPYARARALPSPIGSTRSAAAPAAAHRGDAYYVAEAVTNTVRHARAERVRLTVKDDGAIADHGPDDGVGGACIECREATGLGGLLDRVSARRTLDLKSPEASARPSSRPSRSTRRVVDPFASQVHHRPCVACRDAPAAPRPSSCSPARQLWLAVSAGTGSGGLADAAPVPRSTGGDAAPWERLVHRGLVFRRGGCRRCVGSSTRLPTGCASPRRWPRMRRPVPVLISVPPVVRTRQTASGEAARIGRAGFHALAEIHFTACKNG
jgi:hypothetical protein